MDHHEVNIGNIARVVMALGLDGFKYLSNRMPACSVKYAGLTLGEAEAIFNILGEANMKRMLAGEISIEIKELIQKMVDKNGRFIPLLGSKNAACDPNPNYKLIQPDINYPDRYNRVTMFFPDATFVSVEEFQKRSERLFERLLNDPIFSNLLNGVWLPVCYPMLEVFEYGTSLEEYFLKAVGDSLVFQFLDRRFNNLLKGELAGKIKIVDESHEHFIAKMAKGPLVGLQFFPFQGFSINAVRELRSKLPKSFHLSGPIDFSVAITAYQDVLSHNYSTPGYDCSAVSWESVEKSPFFVVNYGQSRFDCYDNIREAHNIYTSGLVYLG